MKHKIREIEKNSLSNSSSAYNDETTTKTSSIENFRYVETGNHSNTDSPTSNPTNEKIMESLLKQQTVATASTPRLDSVNMDKKPLQSSSSRHSSESTSTANSNASGNLLREFLRARLGKIDESKLEPHLKLGSVLKFRIIILEIAGISSDYSEVFCQFNFMHKINEAFSTEPIKNSGKGPPLGFFHIQNFSVVVTRSLIDYLTYQPLMFEVLGHYQHHPLHNQASVEGRNKQKTPLRYINSPQMSKPIPAKNMQNWKNIR